MPFSDGPDSLNFNVPRQYTVTEGEVVPTVTCSADCWPGCTYTWRNMTYGDTLPNTGMLTLGRVNKYAAGEYSCDAYNNGNGLKKSTSIRIIVNCEFLVGDCINRVNCKFRKMKDCAVARIV
ncbi:hypothetical protein DPMN_075052 [Dreissena polymorpha]|uniref:Ig-like domain-containing protein n=1 Tax=Dreissena polymorpha TaxID=45954 RepID=A0A9D4BL75_DREPO|nr:hypothetical protein DPMN_075052 [Dreissena polymorpha]